MIKPILFALTLGSAAFAAAPAQSTIALASSANLSTIGKALTLTATVTPSSATGDVTFYDGVVPIGAAALAGGSAVLSTMTLGAGAHSLLAYYRGDAQTEASTSAPIPQIVSGLGENGFQKQVTYTGVSNPDGLAAGDFNGDGNLDLVIANAGSNSVAVMLGNGDGTFRMPASFPAAGTPASSPGATVVADFNGDGHLDIATVNGSTAVSTVAVLLGNGDGTFQAAVSYSVSGNPHSLGFCDFNRDGIGDLVTDNFLNSSVAVLLGKPDGSFQPASNVNSGSQPINSTCGDFNGDGYADIAVVNFGDLVTVLLGNGDGTFQTGVTYPAGKGALGIAIGDFNRDGRADLAVANATDKTISILLGNGDGTFQGAVNYPAGADPQALFAGDFNGDGLEDLAVTNEGDNSIGVLLGKGDGTFQAQVIYAAGDGPLPIVAADFNGDGRSDIVVGNYLGATVGVLLGVAVAEPHVTAIVNGASFASTGLSPGLIFTIAGTGLGPAVGQTEQLDSNGRIASTLGGVEVLVNGIPAPLLYARQDQINAVTPYEVGGLTGQNVNVQVIYNQNASNILQVPIFAVSPAIFSLGNGQGAIRNQDQSINGSSNPAAAGSFISIYATGEGQLSPNGVNGELVVNANTLPVAPVSVSIGGISVVPQFAGATEFDGFFQVNAQVPPGISGVVPVVLTVGGQPSPAGITMAIK
jgi:uncharacterized protein (TIGR03437 family)